MSVFLQLLRKKLTVRAGIKEGKDILGWCKLGALEVKVGILLTAMLVMTECVTEN